jgi:hypothetical protein
MWHQASPKARRIIGKSAMSKVDHVACEPNQYALNIDPHEVSDASGDVQGSRTPETPSANRSALGENKRRSSKIATGEPKNRPTEFSVAEDDWAAAIPKPGHYAATVTSASIKLKSQVVFLSINYRIADGDGAQFMLADFLVLDAPREDSVYTRSAQGKGRVKAIMEANGKPLQFSNIQAVPEALIGCSITIAVGHRDVDGLPAPCVQGIVRPAPPAKEEP